MALSLDGESWILVNASPDLRAQIENFRALHPRSHSQRNSPISGVLLTNADLDHVLGLFLLRENSALSIIATDAVRQTVLDDLGFGRVASAFSHLSWQSPKSGPNPLPHQVGDTRLNLRAIPLPASAPRYASNRGDEGQSVAYEIVGSAGTMVIAPDVSQITPELDAALGRAEAILFDGTFWSDTELQRIDDSARTSLEMGHLPIEQSLSRLAEYPARVKRFIHVNNSNPIFNPASAEYRLVKSTGWEVGSDGFEFSA